MKQESYSHEQNINPYLKKKCQLFWRCCKLTLLYFWSVFLQWMCLPYYHLSILIWRL